MTYEAEIQSVKLLRKEIEGKSWKLSSRLIEPSNQFRNIRISILLKTSRILKMCYFGLSRFSPGGFTFCASKERNC